MEPVMGRYLEALTRLFLAGGFPGRAMRAEPIRRERRVVAPAPTRQRAPSARSGRGRKFRPAPREGNMTHPGRILAQHLQDLGLTASDLARDIDVPVNRVTAIINGQRGVTADTALRLGHWFGVEAEDWLELQLQYELALARQDAGATVNKLPRLVDRLS
jgi:addiction module HigA family antidote